MAGCVTIRQGETDDDLTVRIKPYSANVDTDHHPYSATLLMLKGLQLFFSYKRTTGEIAWLQFKSRCVRIKQPTNTKQNSCFMLHRMQLQRDNNFSELHYKSVRENIEQRSTSCSTHHAASIGSYGPSSAI